MTLRTKVGLALLVLFFFVCILWTIWKLVYVAAIRPAFGGTMLPGTSYEVEILAWKAERAGRFDEAIDLYIEALRMAPSNRALRAKLLGITDKPLPPDTTTFWGSVAARLGPGIPGSMWTITDEVPVLTAYVEGVTVAQARASGEKGEVASEQLNLRYVWPGGVGGYHEVCDYFAAAITDAVQRKLPDSP